MQVTLSVLLCGLLLLVTSRKAKVKPTIIGKWESTIGGSIEFHTDSSPTLGSSTGTRQAK